MSTATALSDRIEPARERLGVAATEARERARSGAEVAKERAAEAKERAAEAAERFEPTASRVADTAGTYAKRGLGLLAFLPDVLSRLLEILSGLLSSAAEQGREVAARVEPPRHVRRRRGLKTAGWFGAGFLAGAVAGWIAHARAQAEPEPPYGHVDIDRPETVSPYGEEATAIDARRHNAPVA